jgi:serine/threonine-protein kinase
VKHIGRYEIIKSIAKGGMGEVFLAYDPLCERQIALKCIREDLVKNPILQERFLKEAKITAKLTHPGIISIYSIHDETLPFYYTMPFVEGKTLRQLLTRAHQEQKKRPTVYSIPALMPLFKVLCQTVAYAHDCGILHRDIKPENILVGRYGEVILLDWGVSIHLSDIDHEEQMELHAEAGLTQPGKIVGTLASLAPERAEGSKASIQTEIYALGTILYEILTLELPFHRRSLKEFKKHLSQERLIDPEEKAPYRDVPLRLSKIVKKCLAKDPQQRYMSVKALYYDLLTYFEGSSEWLEESKLSIHKKYDWEFQENVMISKNLALTVAPEVSGWVHMMISKLTFPENIRLQTKLRIGNEGAGIGFLLNVPDASARKTPLDGFCLWLSSDKGTSSQLLRNTIEVMQMPQLILEAKKWHDVTIEKVGEKLSFKVDDRVGFTYISYLPLMGRQLGILSLDRDFEMEVLTLSASSQPLKISCLATPNAFLANQQYKQALDEYRRIGEVFRGHAEGREALFRAGIVLLEQAKSALSVEEKGYFYKSALDEFSKLHSTPGAPYEYLGKSLVYKAQEDFGEEIKYLELGIRRYKKHPLKHILEEQIVYRMHESAQLERRAAYQLITLVSRLIPEMLYQQDTAFLLKQLTEYWEPLPFFETFLPPLSEKREYERALILHLGFWLAAPFILQEQLEKNSSDSVVLDDIIYALFEIRSDSLARDLFEKTKSEDSTLLTPLSMPIEKGARFFLDLEIKECGIKEFRTALFLMHKAIDQGYFALVENIAYSVLHFPISKEMRILLDGARIWAFLMSEDIKKAEELFDHYSPELFNQESTILHALYGCFLMATEGAEIANIHFAGVIDTPFPRSWALLGHQITNNILNNNNWYDQSFSWERRQLYRQLELYYKCAHEPQQQARFAALHAHSSC